jgi:hypothetical protein
MPKRNTQTPKEITVDQYYRRVLIARSVASRKLKYESDQRINSIQDDFRKQDEFHHFNNVFYSQSMGENNAITYTAETIVKKLNEATDPVEIDILKSTQHMHLSGTVQPYSNFTRYY